jgi:hypothetical protein
VTGPGGTPPTDTVTGPGGTPTVTGPEGTPPTVSSPGGTPPTDTVSSPRGTLPPDTLSSPGGTPIVTTGDNTPTVTPGGQTTTVNPANDLTPAAQGQTTTRQVITYPEETWPASVMSTWVPTTTWCPPELTKEANLAAAPTFTGTTVIEGQTWVQTTLDRPLTTVYTSESL